MIYAIVFIYLFAGFFVAVLIGLTLRLGQMSDEIKKQQSVYIRSLQDVISNQSKMNTHIRNQIEDLKENQDQRHVC